jgi:hypothetical protein
MYDTLDKKLRATRPVMWASLGLNAAFTLFLAILSVTYLKRRRTEKALRESTTTMRPGDGSRARGNYQTLGYPEVDDEEKR